MQETLKASFEEQIAESHRLIKQMKACAAEFSRLAASGRDAICTSLQVLAEADAVLKRSPGQ